MGRPTGHVSPESTDSGTALGPGGMTRRGFLRAACAGAGMAAIPALAGAALPDPRPHPRSALPPQVFGLQLYTVRDLLQGNFDYTLRQVAAVGYREVEFAGLFDKEPAKVFDTIRKLGMTSPASHINITRLRGNLSGVVDEAQALGNEYVVCPGVDGAARTDADGWRRVAADFNRIAGSLQRVGLRFAYHNHDYEFRPLPSGETGYDILLAETDPKLVTMELDLYWITKGGRDPLAYFEKWPGRFPLVHVKDMTGNGVMTNVGQGHIDWGRIFAKRREAGIEHFFVEHDNPSSPLEDIKTSFTFMKTLGL